MDPVFFKLAILSGVEKPNEWLDVGIQMYEEALSTMNRTNQANSQTANRQGARGLSGASDVQN